LAFSLLLAAFSCRVALAQEQTKPPQNAIAYFTDVAQKAGLTAPIVFGGKDTKKYIIETTGTGAAIFDYDNDGWPDIFLVNGTTLEGFPKGEAPTNHLYRQQPRRYVHGRHRQSGPECDGLGQGVCVGDYDNDGWEDLYLTYYGKNGYFIIRTASSPKLAEKAGVAGSGKAWGTGCAWVDYDRDGHLDLMIANYVDFDLANRARSR